MKTHPPSTPLWRGLGLSLLLLIGLTACQTPEYPSIPDQTKILSLDFIPSDSLNPGDIMAIRCVIRDSLDPTFNFYWRISISAGPGSIPGGGNLLDAVLGSYRRDRDWWSGNINTVHMVIPDCTQTFSILANVIVDNGAKEADEVEKSESIEIAIDGEEE